MIRVSIYVRPHKLEEVKTALGRLPIGGITVNDVRGCGTGPETPRLFGTTMRVAALPVRIKITLYATDELQEPILEAVRRVAVTGEPGDGKVFVEKIQDVLRVRTGERGELAL